jgi:uncharacterized membrane protein YfcA
MTLGHAALLFVAAIFGGAINSVAGGGSFLCFPALLFTGVPPVNANATNTLALWPGTIASVGAYRKEFLKANPRQILSLVLTGIAGSLVGAIILLKTPQLTFLHMVPWLLASATVIFAFSSRISRWVREREARTGTAGKITTSAALVQLVIAVYIGFFGAGAGILMLALFAFMGMESIHTMNAFKTMLASICNGVALIAFIVARAIWWPQALLMLVGGIFGGYFGAHYAQKVEPAKVRAAVIVIGAGLSIYFFAKQYAHLPF